jgi:hypothetical protein
MAEEKNPTKEDYQKILDLAKANDSALTEIQLNNCGDSKAVVKKVYFNRRNGELNLLPRYWKIPTFTS